MCELKYSTVNCCCCFH